VNCPETVFSLSIPNRLSRWELFLKIRCRDSCIRFEVAGIAEESPTSSGLRCYSASFTVRDIVDRYEFD